MDILFTALVTAILMMGFFFLGVFVAQRMAQDAQETADYNYRRMLSYRMAGVERPGDPVPYVAPPMPKRKRKLPYMAELDRRLRAGERGTVKINEGVPEEWQTQN